jgi:hypothetical protein
VALRVALTVALRVAIPGLVVRPSSLHPTEIETNRVRQRQMETDRHTKTDGDRRRQRQTETDGDRQTERRDSVWARPPAYRSK